MRKGFGLARSVLLSPMWLLSAPACCFLGGLPSGPLLKSKVNNTAPGGTSFPSGAFLRVISCECISMGVLPMPSTRIGQGHALLAGLHSVSAVMRYPGVPFQAAVLKNCGNSSGDNWQRCAAAHPVASVYPCPTRLRVGVPASVSASLPGISFHYLLVCVLVEFSSAAYELSPAGSRLFCCGGDGCRWPAPANPPAPK